MRISKEELREEIIASKARRNPQLKDDMGYVTDRLAIMLFEMVENFGDGGERGKWKRNENLDELKQEALFKLYRRIWKYDEGKKANSPFSYVTTMIQRSFRDAEKKIKVRVKYDDAYKTAMRVFQPSRRAARCKLDSEEWDMAKESLNSTNTESFAW